LRLLPARPRARAGGLAAGPDGGAAVLLPGEPPDRHTVAAGRDAVPAAVPAGRPWLAGVGAARCGGAGRLPQPGQRPDAAPVEIIGHAVAVLYLSAPDADDLDVFVGLYKLDTAGRHVGFPYYAHFEDGPVALGWQRASHREKDTARSTPYLPVLAHRRALPVTPGEVVRLEIEILPSGTRFEAGERLLLVVQGSDINRYPKPLVYARHEDTVNRGWHHIHTGGRYDSHLVLPVLPAGTV